MTEKREIEMPVIAFEEYDLANGMHVILHQNNNLPIATTYLYYHVGSKNEDPERTGFAHFFEHLMFEGTKNIPRGQIDKLITGAGGSLNASTSFDFTNYYFLVPSNQLELAMWIEAERMKANIIDDKGVETQRAVVKEERRKRYDNRPYGSLFEHLAAMVFKGTPYEWLPIGSFQYIDRAKTDEFRAFYKKYYVPNNSVLVLAGDFQRENAKELVNKYFGVIPKGNTIKQPEYNYSLDTKAETKVINDEKTPLPLTVNAWRIPAQTHEDAQALEILTNILSNGQSSRLYKKLVASMAIAVDANAGAFQNEGAGFFYTVTTGNPESTIQSLDQAVNTEIKDLREKGVTQEEFDKAIMQKTTEIVNSFKSTDSDAFAQELPPKAGDSPIVTFPSYSELKLKNGVKVFFVEDKRAPLVTITVRIKSGKVDVPDNTSIPLFYAEMLDKGTLKQNANQFNFSVDSLGASFSATTGAEFIHVTISGLNINELKLIQLLSEAILSPAFNKVELDKEKKKAISNLESLKENPDYLSSVMQRKTIYGLNNPFSQEQTKERIDAVTHEKLVSFHRSILSTQNMTIAVVGDVEINLILKHLQKAFAYVPNKKVKHPVTAASPLFEKPTVFLVDRPSSVQSNISVVSTFPKFAFPEQPELDIAVNVLGGGFSGRLFQNLREKHGWTYGSYTSSARYINHGTVSHLAEVRTDATDSAITEIIKEIKEIGTNPISNVELERTKQYLSGRYLLSLENPQTTATRLLDLDFYSIPKNYYTTLIKRYTDATSEQILKIAKENISKENFAIVVVGNASQIKTKLEKFGKVIVFDTNFIQK
ncbi:hypothetical protein CHS0354_000594 [Potamilus streckersoni]|uniref:Peptidase M16 n=1 Tax=Potamilus streckersoni TaxID=2493646 RepID=A0AAE0T7Y4_9BIVA|nr:hypothetical protein CHS0354_000594 [Potamilus streckersoni]